MKTKPEIKEEIAGLEQQLSRVRYQETVIENRLSDLYEAIEGIRDDQMADV